MRKYRTKIRPRNSKKRKFLLWSFLAFNIFSASFFFFQFNAFVTANYEIKENKKKIDDLSLANEQLGTNFVEINRFKNLEVAAQNLNFEKPEKIHYIRVLTSSVATK